MEKMTSLNILIKLRKIIRSINLESKRIEKEYSISIPQLLTLQFLSSQKNYQSSARELKSYLKLNPSTISGIISRLEKKRLIAKLPKFDDKRISHIALTDSGMNLLKNAPTTLFEQLSEELQELDEQKLEELNNSIDFLVRAMNAEDIEAAPILTSEEFNR